MKNPFIHANRAVIPFCVLILSIFLTNHSYGQTVSITSPVNGAVYASGSTVNVSATASGFLFGPTVTFTLGSLGPNTGSGGPTTFTTSFNTSTLAAGTYSLTATATAFLSSPATNTISITIGSVPPTVVGGSTCGPGTVTLSATGTPSGGTYKWYSALTGGTLLLTSSAVNTYTTPVISATTTYYVSYTPSAGTESTRSAVTATVNSVPVSTFTATSSVNVGSAATITYTGTDPVTSTFTWGFDSGVINSGSGKGPYTVTWSSPGTHNVTLTVTNVAGCTSSTTTVPVTVTAVALSNYGFSKPIILNTSQISNGGITSTLTDFPALVYIKDNALKTGNSCGDKVQFPLGNGGGLTAGTNYDFAFTVPGSGTELSYQVDTYDAVNGILFCWVRIPTLTSTNVPLTFYFGSQSPAHTAATAAATWASDYKAVYHFNEASTSATVLDATSNGRNAIQANTTVTNDEIHLAAGVPIPGGGYSFNGTNTSIIQNTGTNPDITGPFTISAWVYYNGTSSSDNKIVSDEYNFGHGYKLSVKNATGTENLETETRTTANPTPGNLLNAGAVTGSTWQYIQGEFNGAKFVNFINGVQVTTAIVAGAAPEAGSVISMGLDHGSSGVYPDQNFYNGYMDEVRISSVAKTADWIRAEYYNQTNPLLFTDYSGTVLSYRTTATLLVGALVYTWTGLSGTAPTDQAQQSNWDAGDVPVFNGNTKMFIPVVSSGNYPVLTADAGIYMLTIASGAYLNLNGHTLSVGCNIYNNATTGGTGILNASNILSNITWNGSISAQGYYGTNVANTAEIGNMIVNNSAGGTITLTGGPVDIYNQLTITKGNLVVNNGGNGALTLKSSSTLTAGVAAIPSSYSITGTVNVERYISGGSGYRGYRILSSPVNAGTVGINKIYSINYLINSTFLTGTDGAAGGFNKTGNPSLYLYRENMTPLYTTFLNSNNRGIKNISGSPGYLVDGDAGTFNIPIGNGFLFFFRGGLSTVNPYTSSSTPVAATLSASGTLNQGNVQVSNWYNAGSTTLGYTAATPAAVRGFNMVGNPYASSIDWSGFYNATPSLITIPSANVNPTIWELKSGTNTYGTYNAQTGAKLNGGDNIIGSGEGFFIQTNNGGAATLKFTENAKISSQRVGPGSLASAYATKTAYGQYLILNVAKDTINKSEILIGFNPGSTKNYNQMEDDRYISGQAQESMWITTKDSIRVVSKWLTFPKAKQTDTANLTVKVQTSSQYTLTRSELKAIPNLYKVWLLDNYKKDSLDIKQNDKYIFDVDLSDTATYGSNRFRVIIREDPALGVHLLDFAAAKATGGAQLTWKTENEADYTNFTIERSTDNGKTFDAIGGLTSGGVGTYSLLDKTPLNNSTNWYRLKLEDVDGTISYSKAIALMYSKSGNTIASNNINIYPNPTKGPINVSIVQSTLDLSNPINTSYNIIITGSNGTIVKKSVSSQAEWQDNVAGLIPGSYVVQVINNTDKSLVGKGKFVKL